MSLPQNLQDRLEAVGLSLSNYDFKNTIFVSMHLMVAKQVVSVTTWIKILKTTRLWIKYSIFLDPDNDTFTHTRVTKAHSHRKYFGNTFDKYNYFYNIEISFNRVSIVIASNWIENTPAKLHYGIQNSFNNCNNLYNMKTAEFLLWNFIEKHNSKMALFM